MRYEPAFNEEIGETTIELKSNCYTDSFPLLRRLSFRKLPVDLSSQSVPLACAILTARYCGDHFEYAGLKIGADYAEAIRQLIGRPLNLTPVDGQLRRLSTGEMDIASERAKPLPTPLGVERLADSVPLSAVTWSGDFVDASRSSRDFAFGMCHTNAACIAAEPEVSIAVALLHGRDKCRRIHVRAEPADRQRLERVRQALSIVSVGLELA